jgi:urease accessory protein
VLQRLYPEGEAICHHVLVHPPGGIAGGDVLEVDAGLGPGTHAVVTTPGATRFYRSSGAAAVQRARLRLQAGARLEWLPLETLAYDACIAENHLRLDLEPGAQALGWDVLALGLPAADAPFVRGSFLQHLEWPGRWLERARIAAGDPLLLDSPLGWAGRRVLGTVWFAGLGPSQDALREQLLEGARAAIDAAPPGTPAGATSPHPGLVVARVLAPRVEPAMRLLQAVRAAWRLAAWGLQAQPPRVWAT